jgi:hypothetical protein
MTTYMNTWCHIVQNVVQLIFLQQQLNSVNLVSVCIMELIGSNLNILTKHVNKIIPRIMTPMTISNVWIFCVITRDKALRDLI